MRIVVIVNPVSGGGRARGLARALLECLIRDGHQPESFETARPGEARARAAALAEEVQRLVVVGGDGTLNEVLNGLRAPDQVPLAQLPTGTANILGHELRLPRRPEGLARMLRDGAIRRLDLGLIGQRRFLMLASAGFDAMVTRDLQAHRGGTLGYKGYVRPILRVLRAYRPPALQVRVDGGAPLTGGLVVVSNTRNYGGLFSMADRARVDSGHLDVCVVRRATRGALLRTAIRALRGGVSRQRGVDYRTGRRVELTAAEPVAVEVDGDYFGTTPVEITLRPACVPVVVPAAAG